MSTHKYYGQSVSEYTNHALMVWATTIHHYEMTYIIIIEYFLHIFLVGEFFSPLFKFSFSIYEES